MLTLTHFGGRPITNIRFAVDIDLIAASKDELADLMGRLHLAARIYGTEISSEISKIMVTNKNVMNTTLDIRLGGKTLPEVKTFHYSGSTLGEESTSDV